MKTAYVIGSQSVESFRDWFNTRNGVLCWENQEIGSCAAREVFTPGDKTEAPNWRYGSNPRLLTPTDITVEHAEVLESFRGRFKARYWGPDVADGTRKKAEKLAVKHGQDKDSWRWNHDGRGYVIVDILKSRFEPFILEEGN